MNIVERLTNLWKLSQYEPGQPTEEYKTPGTQVSMIVKKPEKREPARFIPHSRRDPVKEITQENTHD